MTRFHIPTAFVAGRKVKLLGVDYAKGATVPVSVAKSLRNLGGLVSRRILVPNVPQSGSHLARVNATRAPESYPSSLREKLGVAPLAAPPAQLDSLTPITGPAAGGTHVTLSGDEFDGTTGVTFGGTAGTSGTIVSEHTITVTTPAHAAGLVNVVVLTPHGNGTKVGGFTYT